MTDFQHIYAAEFKTLILGIQHHSYPITTLLTLVTSVTVNIVDC